MRLLVFLMLVGIINSTSCETHTLPSNNKFSSSTLV